MPTGHPDFVNTPLVQTDASVVNLAGLIDTVNASFSTVFNITDKTSLVGMFGSLAWAAAGGPFIRTITFTFTGNVAGSFHFDVTGVLPGGGGVIPVTFTFPFAVPVRIDSILGNNTNTQVTLTASAPAVLPAGAMSVFTNLVLMS